MTDSLRKHFSASLACMALCAAALGLIPGSPALAFDFDDVVARAKQLAASPYKKPANNIPRTLEKMGYDAYRDIRFRRGYAPWRDKLPFELAFYHQGSQFTTRVKINEVSAKQVREIKFDPKAFDYGKNDIDPKQLSGLGFAGFRVHYPVNTPKYRDEVIVFLGASYFRAVGKGQLYGLSSRGLAIDTALHSGEEFPQFVEFWIERPAPKAKELTIYGLLDSRRASGAYRFVVKPGIETAVDVTAQLYLREHITKLGIAPLNSMYLFGENQRSKVEDYRPEVHDSDGLSIESGTGEWIWRPLVNPKRLLVTSFALTNPRGFGLMQRDRGFSSYEDLESHYQVRPSAWVEPQGQWGAGRVELVQIPTPNEFNDNIVAYWLPDVPPRPGIPFHLEYRLLWQGEVESMPPSAWVTQTRRGRGHLGKQDENIALFVDFEGPALKKLAAEAKVEPMVTADANSKVLETNAYRNTMTGGWRMMVRLRRDDDKKPVELRGYLQSDHKALTETWSYILPPE
jgi:glucans biosynthesis protein